MPAEQEVGRLAAAARAYVLLGWPVFPCVPRGKRPCTAHGLHDATAELEQVDAWWHRWPYANIGLPTGIAFDVVDFDTPDAMAWAQTQGGFPDGPIVETGRGLHVYLTPTGATNRTNLVPGVDYRGRGGYVIAPPSHHVIGCRYRWDGSPRDPIPAAPDWLRELLAEHNTGSAGAVAAPKSLRSNLAPGGTPHLTARGVASLRSMAERLASTPAGNRNALLFWCACTAADTGITQSDVRIVLYDAAQRAGLNDHEIERTLHSAFSRWG